MKAVNNLFYKAAIETRRAFLRLSGNPLAGAGSFNEILEEAFLRLNPGQRFIGPKGQLRLVRNQLPLGHPMIAEIAVERIADNQNLLCVSWKNGLSIQDGWPVKPDECLSEW